MIPSPAAALFVDADRLARVRQKCARAAIDLDACIDSLLDVLLEMPEPHTLQPDYWADAESLPTNVVPLRPRAPGRRVAP